jgi:predicted DNA-binding transcriptional regulator AlpA
MCNLNTPPDYKLEMDPLFSIPEAAAYTGMGVKAFYKYAKKHELPRVRITGDSKIRKSILDDLIRKHEEPWRWGNIYSTNNSKEIG